MKPVHTRSPPPPSGVGTIRGGRGETKSSIGPGERRPNERPGKTRAVALVCIRGVDDIFARLGEERVNYFFSRSPNISLSVAFAQKYQRTSLEKSVVPGSASEKTSRTGARKTESGGGSQKSHWYATYV